MLTISVLCLLLLVLMIGLGGVYKQLYLILLESVIFANLALFAALALYSDDNNNISNVAVYTMVLIGFFCLYWKSKLCKLFLEGNSAILKIMSI